MKLQQTASKVRSRSDHIAMLLSLICLVHCLVLPVALAILPAAAHLFSLPEEVHLALFALAAPISVLALVSGHRLHGHALPAAVAVIGIGLLGCGALAARDVVAEIGLSVLGSLLLLAGHFANLRYRRMNGTR